MAIAPVWFISHGAPGSGPARPACEFLKTLRLGDIKGAGGALGPLVQPKRAADQRRAQPGLDVRLLRLPEPLYRDPLARQGAPVAAGRR